MTMDAQMRCPNDGFRDAYVSAPFFSFVLFCRVLIDWLIILSTYLLTVFLYLTGNLPEGYTFWRTYEVMMRGNPPL